MIPIQATHTVIYGKGKHMDETNSKNETPVYDLPALSKKLKLGVVTLRKYIQRGELKAKKVGRKYLVTELNLLAFLDDDKDAV